VVAVLDVVPNGPAVAEEGVARRAAEGKLPIPEIRTPAGVRRLPSLSGGFQQTARDALAASQAAKASAAAPPPPDVGAGTLGCRRRNPDGNVRVNQDCTFRRQAEETIESNPADPTNLVAGQNDARVGFNHCGFDYSFNSGATWGDGQPPFFQRLNDPASLEPTPADPNRHTITGSPGTLHTYDASSDPALAFDADGRAFYSCVLFDINTTATALLVTSSPPGAGGSFYNNVPTAGPNFVVAEDNSSRVVHDKEFVAADFFAASPNRNNVYVTWTVFRFSPDCGPQPNPGAEERYCSAPIFGSMSTDHALTWSTPEEISGASNALCFFGDFFDPTRPPDTCDFNQGSDPTVLPNGDLVVVFNNLNTPPNDPNGQQLSVRCRPAGSSPAGTARLNCVPPARVGSDVITGEPQCDFGRGPEECIPGAYIRTNDYPRVALNRDNGHLFAAWQDYRTGEFDIQVAQSSDGGSTWTEARAPVNPDRGRDHYFPAIDVAGARGQPASRQNREVVGVSYYRTDRVPGEDATPPGGFAPGQAGVQAGNSDYYLAGGLGLATPYRDRQLSPGFPPPDGIQEGFNGDYSGLVIVNGAAHPIWSDTRNPAAPGQGVARDEDVFTAIVGVP
jgi:hypothetical protein